LDINFKSDVDVQLVKHSASDQDIAFAARVSTIGERTVGYQDNDDNKKLTGLIGYLMRDRHGSPFEHSVFTFYVKAPIFVWREHMRHRMASYNEESGRYRVLEPEFYIPGQDRKLLQIGKPGAYTFEPGDAEHSWAGLMKFNYITIVEALGGDATALKSVSIDAKISDKATYLQ
jgi:thymidylate synthase (FAD)